MRRIGLTLIAIVVIIHHEKSLQTEFLASAELYHGLSLELYFLTCGKVLRILNTCVKT